MYIELLQKDPKIVQRFWSKVDKSTGENGCWNWIAAIDSPGYGAFKINAKKVNSHRVAFAISTGNWPKTTDLVMHSCDNRLCCNPGHLSLGSHKDNTQEQIARGRIAHGERSGRAKLTELQVKAIKKMRTEYGVSTYLMSQALGISRKTLQNIASGHTWRHVENAPNQEVAI